MDGSVIVDVDLGAGFCHDLLDDAAAFADDIPDLVGINVHGDHLGGIGADLGPGLGDYRQHDLVQDLHTGIVGDVQSVPDDLHGQAVVLQVHLNGGDALLGAGHLEVHLTVEVLHALDVYESGEAAVIILNEAAGNAGHGGLDGHTGVHQRQGRAADGALGGGAVGGYHLGYHTDGIGELLHRGDHGQQGALSQRAVADLPAAGAAGGLSLTNRVAGEVVVVHIALLSLLPDGVQLLIGGQGIQGADGEDLGLATGKEAGAVDTGQHAHLGVQRTDLVLLAAVHTVSLQQPRLDDLLLELVGEFFQILIHIRILLQILLVPVLDHLVPAGLPDILIVGIHGGLGLVHKVMNDLVKQLLIEVRVGIVELGLADLGDHLAYEGDLLLILLVGHANGLEHHIVGHLIGAGLDHDHLLAGGDHGDIQITDLALLSVGIEHQLTVHQTHLQGAHGAVPGNVGNGQSGGGADESGNLGGAVVIHSHDGAHHGHIVTEIVGEQGADGAVDDAAGQDALLAGAALTAVKAAGNTAHGVHLLLKVHAQGEEVDAVPGTGSGGDAAEHTGVAVAHHHGGVGQLCQLAHLQSQRPAGQIHLILVVARELALGNDC